MACIVVYGGIHTCDFLNYCVNLKVQEWVVYPFLRDFLRDFCALYWDGINFKVHAIVGKIAGVNAKQVHTIVHAIVQVHAIVEKIAGVNGPLHKFLLNTNMYE